MAKNKNPHKYLIDKSTIKSLETIKRLDKNGYLYFMENTINYASNKKMLKWVYDFQQRTKKWVNTTFHDACSAFCTLDFEGNMLTGRAYDFGHWLKDGKSTGLNIIVHTGKNVKKGIKYETITTTDVSLCGLSLCGAKLRNGQLDDNKTDISFLQFIPYTPTDGINEKGLTVSILLLPLDNCIEKYKEEPNAYTIYKSRCKFETSIPNAVRLILDNCKTVKEAEEMLKKIWFLRYSGNNSHIFVTDKTGESRLFEWYLDNENAKTQKFISIKTNAATNFYQAFSYMPKGMPQLINLKNHYQYGYSKEGVYRNTYDRFNTIVSMLDFYTVKKAKKGELNQAIMKKQTADAILRTIALYPAPSSTNHQTQYSQLFDAKNLTQTTYSFANLEESWTYSLKEHKFI